MAAVDALQVNGDRVISLTGSSNAKIYFVSRDYWLASPLAISALLL